MSRILEPLYPDLNMTLRPAEMMSLRCECLAMAINTYDRIVCQAGILKAWDGLFGGSVGSLRRGVRRPPQAHAHMIRTTTHQCRRAGSAGRARRRRPVSLKPPGNGSGEIQRAAAALSTATPQFSG